MIARLSALFWLLLLGCPPSSGTLATNPGGADDDDAADDDDVADDDDDVADDDDATPPDDDDATPPDDDDDDSTPADDDDATPGDLALGYVHDQDTVLTTDHGLQEDMWVRIAGGGEDQASFELRPGLYDAGPNGVHEQGRNDDVLVQSLSASDLVINLGNWEPVNEASNPPHSNDGSPSSYAAGFFDAGSDTGELPVILTHGEGGTIETRLQVTPPDWCPLGEHEGGSWNPGFCL